MKLFRDCFQHLHQVERKRIPPTPRQDLRLHRLERPLPWHRELLDEIDAALAKADPFNCYPDYAPLYEKLAFQVGVPKDWLVVGAGIEDFIRSLVMLCCDPGDGVAFTWPTCAMFDIYATVFGAKARRIVTNPDVELTPEAVIAFIERYKPKLLILPNPGQPVETCFDRNGIKHIAYACRQVDAVLAVDEAYYGFGAPSAHSLIWECNNLVVLRTFSKAFGAAGIRVGYAMGQRSVIAPLDAVRESGEIAGPSLTMATVLLEQWATHVVPGIARICEGRDWLKEMLLLHGFKARGTYANHVLIDVGSSAQTVADRLRDLGVHVKAAFPAPLDRHLLVTAGPLDLMQEFLERFLPVAQREAA